MEKVDPSTPIDPGRSHRGGVTGGTCPLLGSGVRPVSAYYGLLLSHARSVTFPVHCASSRRADSVAPMDHCSHWKSKSRNNRSVHLHSHTVFALSVFKQTGSAAQPCHTVHWDVGRLDVHCWALHQTLLLATPCIVAIVNT